MEENHLKIIATSNTPSIRKNQRSPEQRQIENEARCEREWLQDPELFVPKENILERKNFDQCWNILRALPTLKDVKVVDIGCGSGAIDIKLHEEGADVLATDIASNALKWFKTHGGEKIETQQTGLPQTVLPDSRYDVVLCLNVIADCDPLDFRLAMSELARLVKSNGMVICSTALDYRSEDSLDRFISLADTEFIIEEWSLNYDSLYLQLLSILKAPERYAKASRNPLYKRNLLKDKKSAYGRFWFGLQSSKVLGRLWGLVSFVLKPLIKFAENSDILLSLCEKVTKFLRGSRGASSVVFKGKKRALEPPKFKETFPDRPPFRKEKKWE